MKRVQQGFTLIELMIVVAIIGILAAIAIPAYQDYTAKAKATAAIAEISGGKTAFEVKLNEGTAVADLADIGLAEETANCDMAIDATAGKELITCTVKNAPNALKTTAADDVIIRLNRSTGQWVCQNKNAKADLMPASCTDTFS